jgi:alkylhydroperoxidase family enzyme
MILRNFARCGAEYEWGVHVAGFGEKAQWTPAQIHASVHGDARSACSAKEERLVLELADELHDTSTVSVPLWQRAAEHYSAVQLIELIMLAGLYHAVSFMVNACAIQHEPFAPRFPSAA